MASKEFPVAVVGMACHLPGAKTSEEFWQLMMDKKDTVGPFPKERADQVAHVMPHFNGQLTDPQQPFFTGSFFNDVDKFDNNFFGISSTEAQFIEPEQRIFLQTVYKLFEDAGVAPNVRGSNTGVYVGNTVNKYKQLLTENHPSISHGNHSPFIASRVSYTFDLHGPALMVATGCSSSLLAVHIACQGLLSGDCDQAVAGGITLDLLPVSVKTDIWNQLGITSENQRCRAFDKSASGIAKGEGCGVVLLKPLHKAILDGNHIYGVLQSTVANQDGRSNGITAPHPLAQADMLLRAWTRAGVNPNDISYIEAHGTGTKLGDPIEVKGIQMAVSRALQQHNLKPKEKIMIQSVKANIGHLADGAAGVISLIKVLLCMHHKHIPGALHFNNPNPFIDWKEVPVVVNTEDVPWEAEAGQVRTAGVNSFGLLGTNIHTVVTDPPKREERREIDEGNQKKHIMVLTAKTKKSLQMIMEGMSNYFQNLHGKNEKLLEEICYTINCGREHNRMPWKAVVAAEGFEAMESLLRTLEEIEISEYIENDDIDQLLLHGGITVIDATNCRFGHFDAKVDLELNVISFMKGEEVNWKPFYDFNCNLVPMLPTYVFDENIFWPITSKDDLNNAHMLQLEYKGGLESRDMAFSDESNSNESGISSDDTTGTFTQSVMEVILKDNLNSILASDINWEKEKDSNLFCLGLDSLMSTELVSQLVMAFEDQVVMSFHDLHTYPTFAKLTNFLWEQLKQQKNDSNKKTNDEETQSFEETIAGSIEEQNDGEKVVMMPASGAQSRLWVTELMCANKCAYNCANGLLIEGDFRPKNFVHALQLVTDAHGAFHTSFVKDTEKNKLYQKICWDDKPQFIISDLTSYKEPLVEAKQRFAESYSTPFDLENGPLAVFSCCKLEDNKFFIYMVIHHIIFDGWSHFLFMDQVWKAYNAICNNSIPSLKHNILNITEDTNNDQMKLNYWNRTLGDDLVPSTIPGDKKRPNTFTANGERIVKLVPIDLVKQLRSNCGPQYTMFSHLMTAVGILLHKYCQKNEVILGFPAANRKGEEQKNLIGFMVNSVPVKFALDGSHTYAEAVEAMSTGIACAISNQVPFDMLVKQLDSVTNRSNTETTPIFSTNVCYHSTQDMVGKEQLPSELQVTRVLPHNGSAKWDWYFDFLEEGDSCRFTLEYYTGISSSVYANMVADNLLSLIKVLGTMNPCHTTVKELLIDPLTMETEVISGKLMKENLKDIKHTLIESLVYHDGNKIAVTNRHKDFQWSYTDILIQSARLAKLLSLECHLPFGAKIGLLLDNSANAITATISCLLSHYTYVPLDPESPKSRLEDICNKSEIQALILLETHSEIGSYLKWTCDSIDVLVTLNHEHDVMRNTDRLDNPLMDSELWDHVADSANNTIEGGGWTNSFELTPFSAEEMCEYAENVYHKLSRYLSKDSKVLEIGCASGLTAEKISPFVGEYVATDLSKGMVEKLRKRLQDTHPQLRYVCTPADRVQETFECEKFDIILINSVVHCFPSYDYLENVLKQCETLLKLSGILFIGDVMDLKKKKELIETSYAYKQAHPSAPTKLNWMNELFVTRKFFENLSKSTKPLNVVVTSSKIGKHQNELTKFRYDVLLTKSETKESFKISQCHYGTSDLENMICSRDEAVAYIKVLMKTPLTIFSGSPSAYILFTSGTTGSPKGVEISQQALNNYIASACQLYNINSQTVMPFFSPLSFDFTVTSLLCPIVAGGQIFVFEKFTNSIHDITVSSELNCAKFTPLQLKTMLLEAEGKPLSTSTYILGGEPLEAELLASLKTSQKDRHFTVWNEYGPTETTVGCIVKEYDSTNLPLSEDKLVVIGRPFPNTKVLILDNDGLPVLPGAKGQLALGGIQVCHSITGQKDASLHYSQNERWYMTDDIVLMMPNGEIVQLGRMNDCCAKLNGIRIDLTGIRQTLQKMPCINDALPTLVTLDSGETLLGAAVSVETDIDLDHLRTNLNAQLTVAEQPKIIVVYKELPQNINGKVDIKQIKLDITKQLSKCENSAHSTRAELEFSEEENEILKKIFAIWEDVVPAKMQIHYDSDFFIDLSGDSLLAIHAVRRMQHVGLKLNVSDLFRYSSPRKLVQQLITKDKPPTSTNQEVPVAVTDVKPTPIISDFLQCEPNHTGCFAMPALVKLNSTDGNKWTITELANAIKFLKSHHWALNSKFLPDKNGVKQVANGVMEIKVEEITIEKSAKELIQESTFNEFFTKLQNWLNISEGKVFLAGLIHYSENDFLLLVAHHFVVDLVSWAIIIEDLTAFLGGNQASVVPVVTTWPEFVKKLHKYSLSNEEYDLWKNMICKVGNNTQILPLPQNSNPTFKDAKFHVCALENSSNLHHNSTKEEAKLVQAVSTALCQLSGVSKTAICMESHGRTLPNTDLSSTVGWCTSRFPMVFDENDTITDIEEILHHVPNGGIGFGLLREQNREKFPLPQIMFVYDGNIGLEIVKHQSGTAVVECQHWVQVMGEDSSAGIKRTTRDPKEKMEFDIEFVGWKQGGKGYLGALYNQEHLHADFINDLFSKINEIYAGRKIVEAKEKITLRLLTSTEFPDDAVVQLENSIKFYTETSVAIELVPEHMLLQSLATENVEDNIGLHLIGWKTPELLEEYITLLEKNAANNSHSIAIDLSTMLPEQLVSLSSDQCKRINQSCAALIQLPSNLKQHADNYSMQNFNMAFSKNGYDKLVRWLAKVAANLLQPSLFKVLVVDADYTLWNGECANGSITVDEHYLRFHYFLKERKREGYLLALISKNNKDDVLQALHNQSSFGIQVEDFISIQANWKPKYENVHQLAKRLNLGLSEFIFIDDSEVECAEMIKAFPQMLTLLLPKSSHMIPRFLEDLWFLQKPIHSTSATNNNAYYKGQMQRNEQLQLLKEDTLLSMLSTWDIKLTSLETNTNELLTGTAKIHLQRVNELLARTNQFKLNGEMLKITAMPQLNVILFCMEDKFGSYGIISIVCFTVENSVLLIEQWVLSCRALGKRVEHAIITSLVEKACSLKCHAMKLKLMKTGRNLALLKFLQSLNSVKLNEGYVDVNCRKESDEFGKYDLSTTAKIIQHLSQSAFEEQICRKDKDVTESVAAQKFAYAKSSMEESIDEAYKTWITMQCKTIIENQHHKKCLKFLHFDEAKTNTVTFEHAEARGQISETRGKVQQMWMEALDLQNCPKSNDTFIDFGGNSFKAVHFLSALHDQLYVDIKLTDLFEKATFSNICNMVEQQINNIDVGRQDSCVLPECNQNGLIPLSVMQQSMLRWQMCNPESTAYVETVAAHIEDMNMSPLVVFRSILKQIPNLTFKVITDAEGQRFTKQDETALLENIIEEKCSNVEDVQAVLKHTTPVLDKINGLVKFRWFNLDTSTVLAIHVHHCLVDDVSLSRISNSLALTNSQIQPSQSSALLSFAESEKAFMISQEHKKQEKFWKKRLEEIHFDGNFYLRTKEPIWHLFTKPYQAEHITKKFNKKEWGLIGRICKDCKLTRFQFLMACFALVLKRYLGSTMVPLLIPTTKRSHKYKDTFGNFINTVFFGMEVDESEQLEEFFKKTGKLWLECLENNWLPIDEVLELARLRNINLPLYYMFNLNEKSRCPNDLTILGKHAKALLSLDIWPNKESLNADVVLEFTPELLETSLAQNILQSFKSFVLSVANRELNLDNNLECLAVISDKEHKQIGNFSSNTSISHTSFAHNSVLDAFLSNVKHSPTSPAVYFNGKSLTYKQLDLLSHQIAVTLLAKADRNLLQSCPVLLLMNKSIEAIASIIAVWKTGGYFLPLKPELKQRLNILSQQEKITAVLTFQEHLKDVQDFDLNCPIIDVLETNFLPNLQKFLPTKHMGMQKVAYAIQTSGTTGQPKLFKIGSEGLLTMAKGWRTEYNLDTTKNVSVLGWASFVFDVFIGDVIRSLVSCNGQLVLCEDDKRLDIKHVLNLIEEKKVTTMEVTPQYAYHLVSAKDSSEKLSSVQLFIVGSDTISSSFFNHLTKQLHFCKVVNSYGMSETTIDSTYFEGLATTAAVPIGKPFPGVTVNVVQKDSDALCPIGTTGELEISGPTVALGYGTNMRTGDIARWLPSGDIELIGRNDSLLKIRGFRISAIEIENCIKQSLQGNYSVHVTVQEDHLCAFISNCGMMKPKIDVKNLKRTIACHLVPYMVPDFIVELDKVPLNENGKVDKRAWPALKQLINQGSITEPFTTTQTVKDLENILLKCLGLPNESHINPHMPLMEQGVNSLVLLQYANAINDELEMDVSVPELFSYPTLALLGEHLGNKDEIAASTIVDHQINSPSISSEPIAIVGVGLLLPGQITNLREMWQAIENNENLTNDFPDHRAKDVLSCCTDEMRKKFSDSTKFQGSFLKQVGRFDEQFFNISPGEAKILPPEQRLFLQVSTEALHDADLLNNAHGQPWGVFVGTSDIEYSKLNQPDNPVCIPASMKSIIASRVAYHYNLTGPTMVVDTACSSSLVALQRACESIHNGESQLALVGGVSLQLYPARQGCFSENGLISPDFYCRAFDANSKGTSVGEGVISMLLMKQKDAERLNKHIYGLVTGFATNSVGRGMGITAPSSDSQAKVIQAALDTAHLKPDDINFIETHGTGTQLGDAIELAGLKAVFNKRNVELPIGSAKPQFGHLDAVSGLLSVARVLACLNFGSIPSAPYLKTCHKELETGKLLLPTSQKLWPYNDTLRVGISSFGLSGTNCHAIIEKQCNAAKTTLHPTTNMQETLHELLLPASSAVMLIKQLEKLIAFLTSSDVQEMSLAVLCNAFNVKTAQAVQKYQGKDKQQNNSQILIIQTRSVDQLVELVQNISALLNTTKSLESVQLLKSCELQLATSEKFKRMEASSVSIPSIPTVLFDETHHWLDETEHKMEYITVDLLERKLRETRELVRTLPLTPPDSLESMQAAFCVSLIAQFFRKTKLHSLWKIGAELSFEEAFFATGIHDRYNKLFFVMIRELANSDYIKGKDKELGKFVIQNYISEDKAGNPEVISKKAMELYPSYSDCFSFPLYCSQYYEKVLLGSMSPISVIYPKGDMDFMFSFNKLGDLMGDVYFNMYMQLISECTANLSKKHPNRTLRILEVGAGVGHVTRQLIPKIAKLENVEYWFTDLGNSFVTNASNVFAKYGDKMKFKPFDITIPAEEQGIQEKFDIIISYNVVHTTDNATKSVENLKSSLENQGLFFLIESSKNETWSTLAWGLLDGWWYFKDYDLRPADPMLLPHQWIKVLNEAGYSNILVCPQDAQEQKHVEKFLYLCSMDKQMELKKETEWWEEKEELFNPNQQVMEVEEIQKPKVMMSEQEIMKKVTEIWEAVLGLKGIRLDDQFSDLGGESLLAIQMMANVRKQLGFSLEIADTYSYPTIRLLGGYIHSELALEQREEQSQIHFEQQVKSQQSLLPPPATKPALPIKKKTMLMFPGQGAQKIEMCQTLLKSNAAIALFNKASAIVGMDILATCLEKNPNNLSSTKFVQIALYTSCLAKIEQLKEDEPELLKTVEVVAGLSVGEFVALVHAGALTFEEGLKLVWKRGELMENLVQSQPTGMVSVYGPSTEKLQEFLKNNFPNMMVSTFLADTQHAVAGSSEDCEQLVRTLQTAEVDMQIIDVRQLRTAGAFHSSFMEPIQAQMETLLKDVDFKSPILPVVLNASAQMSSGVATIKEAIFKQLVAPVQWCNMVLTALDTGINDFVEVSPSRVLSSIVQHRIEKCQQAECTQRFIRV